MGYLALLYNTIYYNIYSIIGYNRIAVGPTKTKINQQRNCFASTYVISMYDILHLSRAALVLWEAQNV